MVVPDVTGMDVSSNTEMGSEQLLRGLKIAQNKLALYLLPFQPCRGRESFTAVRHFSGNYRSHLACWTLSYYLKDAEDIQDSLMLRIYGWTVTFLCRTYFNLQKTRFSWKQEGKVSPTPRNDCFCCVPFCQVWMAAAAYGTHSLWLLRGKVFLFKLKSMWQSWRVEPRFSIPWALTL